MSTYLWVGLGGFLGSVARYAVAVWLGNTPTDRFPWATFAVNCLGCLLIGVMAGWLARASVPESARLFLVTGILGGFTTFSAFSLDAVLLWERGAGGAAAAYVIASVALSIAGLAAGVALVRALT